MKSSFPWNGIHVGSVLCFYWKSPCSLDEFSTRLSDNFLAPKWALPVYFPWREATHESPASSFLLSLLKRHPSWHCFVFIYCKDTLQGLPHVQSTGGITQSIFLVNGTSEGTFPCQVGHPKGQKKRIPSNTRASKWIWITGRAHWRTPHPGMSTRSFPLKWSKQSNTSPLGKWELLKRINKLINSNVLTYKDLFYKVVY